MTPDTHSPASAPAATPTARSRILHGGGVTRRVPLLRSVPRTGAPLGRMEVSALLQSEQAGVFLPDLGWIRCAV